MRQVSEKGRKKNISNKEISALTITKEIRSYAHYSFNRLPIKLIETLLPFITLAVHDHVYAPVKEAPFTLKASDPVTTEVVSATAFISRNKNSYQVTI